MRRSLVCSVLDPNEVRAHYAFAIATARKMRYHVMPAIVTLVVPTVLRPVVPEPFVPSPLRVLYHGGLPRNVDRCPQGRLRERGQQVR